MPLHGDLSDAQLLADDQNPAKTFSLFYNRHIAAIMGFSMARGLGPHDAADLSSDVFVAALSQRYKFTDTTGEGGRPWLLGIARNKINGESRRSKREQDAMDKLRLRLKVSDTDAEAYYLAQERIRLLLSTVQDLNEDQQVAFLGRHVHDQTYPELAALQGASEEVVRRRVSRAVHAIRARLGGQR